MEEPLTMAEPLTMFPASGPPGGGRGREPREEQARRRLLRRLLALLVGGGLAFVLTIWVLVRVENPASLLAFGSGPSSVVRAHLAALNRGDLRTAYELFSAHYRKQIPFEAYHELVATHREMFRTRELEFRSSEVTEKRAVLETRLLAADGERYLARFTMVRLAGRWWIDDVRWGAEPRRRGRMTV